MSGEKDIVDALPRPTSHGSEFSESKEIYLEVFLESGVTISSERCVQTLTNLKQRIRRVRQNSNISQVFLLHDYV
jgi:hypothetical protein